MLEDIKNELYCFLEDINQNIKDQDDFVYIRQRSEKLIDVILKQIEKVINSNERKINSIIKKQEQEEVLIQELNEKLEDIYEDIYDEEETNFTIICPYCNHEFDAEIDENYKEIQCPECGNQIELDWNGNPDDDSETGCNGKCPNCGGC